MISPTALYDPHRCDESALERELTRGTRPCAHSDSADGAEYPCPFSVTSANDNGKCPLHAMVA